MSKGLGKVAWQMKITKPMRSRISDTLTPPPSPAAAAAQRPLEAKYDPKVVAERVWMVFLSESRDAVFDAKFVLDDKRSFALRGDKEGFGTIQPMEPFEEVHERLLDVYHDKVTSIEVYSDERGLTFSSYADLVEWLELD